MWFQITTLRESRGTAVKALEQQKEVNQQQQADLSLANQRLRMAKQNIQVSPHYRTVCTFTEVHLSCSCYKDKLIHCICIQKWINSQQGLKHLKEKKIENKCCTLKWYDLKVWQYSTILFFSSIETDHWHGQSVTRESFPGGSVSGGEPSHYRHRQTHRTGLENPGVSTEGRMSLKIRVYWTSITGLIILTPFWSLLSFCRVI